ncbi:hypothetical protein, partial [Paenibacillus zanthoxyli]|uniref:hypothetical protein n=1 Tax=Paenibacillus zanthoxyli TaxID=369399 RepID=UPI001E552838
KHSRRSCSKHEGCPKQPFHGFWETPFAFSGNDHTIFTFQGLNFATIIGILKHSKTIGIQEIELSG